MLPIAPEPPRVSHRHACPAFARARLHVDDAAVITCLRGHFGQPGYFLHAFYKTTEWWERELVVSEDGSQELVPAVDEPSLAIANDGDAVAFHVMAPGDDGATTAYQRPAHPDGADWIWIRSRDRLHVLIPSSADGFQHRDMPVTGLDTWDLELVGGRLIEH